MNTGRFSNSKVITEYIEALKECKVDYDKKAAAEPNLFLKNNITFDATALQYQIGVLRDYEIVSFHIFKVKDEMMMKCGLHDGLMTPETNCFYILWCADGSTYYLVTPKVYVTGRDLAEAKKIRCSNSDVIQKFIDFKYSQ